MSSTCFHIVGHVAKSGISLVRSGFLGQSNQDANECGTEILHRRKIHKQMTDPRLTQLSKCFVLAVSNIVVAKFHKGTHRGQDQDLTTLFKTENLLILTHSLLSNLEDSLFTNPGAIRRAGPCRVHQHIGAEP